METAASSSPGKSTAKEGKGEVDKVENGGGGEVSPGGKGRISKKRPRQEESGSPDPATLGRPGALRWAAAAAVPKGRLERILQYVTA